MSKIDWQKSFPEKPNSFHHKVSATLLKLPDKPEKEEKLIMDKKVRSRIPMKRVAVFALVAMLALGTTAFAAGKVMSQVGGSSAIPTYTEMPTAAQIDKDFDMTPNLVEKFDNGYKFQDAAKGSFKDLDEDEDENVLGEYKTLGITYAKGSDNLHFSVNKASMAEQGENAVLADTYNKIELFYTNDTYKFLPADYEMTAQDKEDEAAGKYIFSFGSDKAETSQIQSVTWTVDGLDYILMATDSTLTQEDLLKMVHEVIDAK
ncbi:MAG: hypothetical protein RSB05_05490 [Clostridiales bacterium]